MRPKDFWRLHPIEFWWLMEARRPARKYGSMSETEVAEIYSDMQAMGMIENG